MESLFTNLAIRITQNPNYRPYRYIAGTEPDARNPWGPWHLAWHTHKATLREDPEARPFSPYWIPGFCDLDAGVDEKGRVLRDCFFSVAGIGATSAKGWVTETMARYGVNIGRIRFAFDP